MPSEISISYGVLLNAWVEKTKKLYLKPSWAFKVQTHPLSKRLVCVFIIILNWWTTNDNTLVNNSIEVHLKNKPISAKSTQKWACNHFTQSQAVFL